MTELHFNRASMSTLHFRCCLLAALPAALCMILALICPCAPLHHTIEPPIRTGLDITHRAPKTHCSIPELFVARAKDTHGGEGCLKDKRQATSSIDQLRGGNNVTSSLDQTVVS